MRALKSLSILSIPIFLPLLFYIFSLSLQAVQGSQTSVINSSTFAAYPAGQIANAIIISSTLLDEGQPITITAQVSGGTSPYTYNFIISQSGNPSNIIAFSRPVSNSLTSNSFVWATNAIGTFVANVIVIDSANVQETANSTYSIPFSVNAYPVATNLTSSNTILDSGQYVTYNLLISGGTLPITANLVLAFNSIPIQINGVNALPGTAYNTIVASSDGIITFNSLLITTSSSSGGSVTFNVFAVDSASTPVTFNAVANTIKINSAPLITLTPSNTVLDSGQTETYTMQVSGGAGPFDVELYNITGNKPVGNVIISSPSESNTISFIVNSTTSGNTFEYNAIATDKGTVTPYVFSSFSNTIKVNPALSASISPTSNTLDANQVLLLTAAVNGGTPSFTIQYTLSNTLCGSLSASTNTLSADGTNTIAFTANSALTSACSTTLDALVVDSTSATVTANAMLTINANTLTSTTSTTSTITSTSTSSNSTIITTVIPKSIYNLEIDSNLPIQISFNGINYLVPNSIPVSTGNYPINALPVSNFVFSNWQVSNSNASIANTTAANTIVAISGNAIIKANFNALTTFYESGLPSNTAWNVTFNGNTNNAIAPNSIFFITAPGQYSFQVANQVIGSNTFVPYPANGLVYAGNSITINFSILTTSTASTASKIASNTISNNTNLIIEGLPYGIGLNLTLLSGGYIINGTKATTNYNIHFITKNGDTVITLPSNIKPVYGNYILFGKASLIKDVDLSGKVWAYNKKATSPAVISDKLVYGQKNILAFYSPFNLTSFYLTEIKQLEAMGVSTNSSIISYINNLAANNTINLNVSNILSADQITNIISANTFVTGKVSDYLISTNTNTELPRNVFGTNLNASLIAYKIITKDIPYGHIKLSGNYLSANKAVSFSVFNSSQRTLYIIKANIIKASPQLCVDTNLGNVCTTTNQTTPVPLGVPVINGHFGLTQNNWYPLNVSFKSSLLANNTASWNVTIKDITSNTILFSNTINSKNINITKNYKIPVTHQVEMKMIIKTSGNSNYTSLIEDPITVPSDIVEYVPITISYNGLATYLNPFQQVIAVNALNYTSYIVYNNNFANFEYFYANGTIIPAWIESNNSNIITTWVKLSNTIFPNTGSSSTTNTIYLGFASKTTNLLSSSGTSGIGEAPGISSTYGAYDDGASVFLNYFSGATSSGWTIAGAAGQTTSAPSGNPTFGTDAFYADSSNGDYMYTTASLSQPVIIQYFTYTTGLGDFFFTTSSSGAGTMSRLDSRGGSDYIGLAETASWTSWHCPESGITASPNTWYQWSIIVDGNEVADYYSTSFNYGSLGTVINPLSSTYTDGCGGGTETYVNNGNYIGLVGDALGSSYVTYWQGIIVRAYPPNGVMPSVSFTKAVRANICTITLGTSAINFGAINAGSNMETSNAITDTNTGNANAYMFVYGGNWIGPVQFGVSNTTWSATANTPYISATRLSTLAANTTIFVPAGGTNTIYFGLAVPGGAPVGAYTQNIVIANQC